MKKLFILLLAIILIAGCTGNREVKVDSNNGLIFNSFLTDVDVVREDDGEFNLYMDVENVGEKTANNMKVDIYGINWKTNSGVYSHVDFRQGYGGEDLYLYPPQTDVVPNIPGEFQTFEWSVCVPDLPEGSHQTFPIIGRVTFDYGSSSIATLPVLTRGEYTRRIRAGIEYSDDIICTNTRGPIHVDIEGERPLIVATNRAGDETASYRITFTNVGDGIPITNNTDGLVIDGLVIANININGYGARFDECFGKTATGDGKIIELDNGEIKLRKGESITKGCTVKINRDLWNSMTEDTVTFIIELEYGYYIQKTISITVYGQEDSPVACNGLAPSGTVSGGGDIDISIPKNDAWCRRYAETNGFDDGDQFRCEPVTNCQGGQPIAGDCDNDEKCCLPNSESGGGTPTTEVRNDAWCQEQARSNEKDNYQFYACVDTAADINTGINSCVCESGIPKRYENIWCDINNRLKCCIPANSMHAQCQAMNGATDSYRAVDTDYDERVGNSCKTNTGLGWLNQEAGIKCCEPENNCERF